MKQVLLYTSLYKTLSQQTGCDGELSQQVSDGGERLRCQELGCFRIGRQHWL